MHIVILGKELLFLTFLSISLVCDCVHVSALPRYMDQFFKNVMEYLNEAFTQVLKSTFSQTLKVSLDRYELNSLGQNVNIYYVLALFHETFLLHLVTAMPFNLGSLIEVLVKSIG